MASASVPATCSDQGSGTLENSVHRPNGAKKSVTMDSSAEMEELRRVQLASEGMKLLLCSRLREAEELFEKSRFQGPQLNVGFSLVALVKSLASFEDDDLDYAYKQLEATEKYCSSSRGLFHRSSSSRAHLPPHESLHRRSIVADCLLFEAVLVFLKQGFTSYVKGGYILRKAWKAYEKIHAEMEEVCTTRSPIVISSVSPVDSHVGISIYDKKDGAVDDMDLPEAAVDMFTTSLPGFMAGEGLVVDEAVPEEDDDVKNTPGSESSQGSDDIDSSVLGRNGLYTLPEIQDSAIQVLDDPDARLRGAVYFGYGLMNIIVSLVPPKLMKVANLLGFHGSRRVGLQALEYASQSQDMKAPLARLALLWYHTIVRPFFALDGEQEDAGAKEATRLLTEANKLYPESAFFLYFKGKVHYLRSELNQALDAYSDAASLAHEQREIEHVCIYEKGWINFLQLKFAQALPSFTRLKNETRWSACFYAYQAAITAGMQGNLPQAREFFLQCCKLVKRKNNNLEKFCARRASVYKSGPTPLMQTELILMTIELIYLWRALPFCTPEHKGQLLSMLDQASFQDAIPYHHGMRALLRGCLLVSLGEVTKGEMSLFEALKFERVIKHDKHIMSYALYELALLHITRDEFAKARLFLTHAKDNFSGYEFEARLNFKVHSAMALLR